MIIFMNPYAGGGTAHQKLGTIETELNKLLGPLKIVFLKEKELMKENLSDLLKLGYREFVAGGGDGTVNLLLQNLIELVPAGQLSEIKIGAIGLGSSNDFHKPFRTEQMLNGIPCKLNFSFARARDVGILTYVTSGREKRQKYWLINASIGITAEANLLFNTPDTLLNYLKRTRTHWAILYAAFRTIACYRNRHITVTIGKNKSRELNLTNMGILKSPFFSGNFSYNTPFETDTGQFHINICRDMNLVNTLTLLWNLSKSRFSGLPKTASLCSDRLTVASDKPFAVEFDGEVINTALAVFKIKQKLIRVCTC